MILYLCKYGDNRMKIEELSNLLSKSTKIQKLGENIFKIETGATFLNGQPLNFVLEQKENRWFLTDGKTTMKYMNELYELKADDVKMCIKTVLKIYGFSMQSATIVTEITNPDFFIQKYYDMIMCIGQLANMFAFFDKP